MDLSESAAVLEAFIDGNLRARIANLERMIQGSRSAEFASKLDSCSVEGRMLEAAGNIKRFAGQVNVIVHTIGILLCLPHILRNDEVIGNVSLGAGNTGRAFDLETNQRIAEFKFIRWRGGPESIRQNGIFRDFYKLAEYDTKKERYLYVLEGRRPLAFLTGRRALSSVLKDHSLQRDFFQKFGSEFTVVQDYYRARRHLVKIEDVSGFLPELSEIEETPDRLQPAPKPSASTSRMTTQSIGGRLGCREEILVAARRAHASGHSDFTPAEIIRQMQQSGTRYPESTIRTHIISRMCANAPENHPTTYADLERVGPGRYRLRNL